MHSRIWIAALLLALLASTASFASPATEPLSAASTPAPKPDSQDAVDEASDPIALRLREIDRTYTTATFNELSTSSNPRDWASAVLVIGLKKDVASEHEQMALLDRALAAAPDDALVQWIGLTQSNRVAQSATTREAIVQTLERLEPDNAAVWMEALMLASQHKDPAAIDAALARMAASVRSDEHFSDLIKVQLDVFKRYPWPDEYFVLVEKQNPDLSSRSIKETAPYTYAVVITAAFALPAYQSLTRACTVNPTTGENATRAKDCASIGRLMVAHGTTLIANRMGASVLRLSRTFNDDDVERARKQDWIRQQKTTLYGSPTAEPTSREVIANMNDWIETGSELESMRRAVARAGKPLTPPADWVDENSPFSPERLRNGQLAADRATPAPAH